VVCGAFVSVDFIVLWQDVQAPGDSGSAKAVFNTLVDFELTILGTFKANSVMIRMAELSVCPSNIRLNLPSESFQPERRPSSIGKGDRVDLVGLRILSLRKEISSGPSVGKDTFERRRIDSIGKMFTIS
jgi:hypothetical protein